MQWYQTNESDYGFKPSKSYELSLLALVNPMKKTEQGLIKLSSIGFNFTMAYSDASSWDGVRTPNSEAIKEAASLINSKAIHISNRKRKK